MMSPRRGAWWLSSVVAVEMALTLSAQPPRSSFDVASVKRTTDRKVFPPQVGLPGGRFHRANATVADLVQYAYNIMSFQVVGGPEWIRRDRFEIDARAGGDATAEEVRLMVRSLLADRFGFMARWEQRDMEHSVLVVAQDGSVGPGLTRCEDTAKPPAPKPLLVPPGGVPLTGRCQSISSLAGSVAYTLGTPVVVGTGLEGLWSYQLVFVQPGSFRAGEPGIAPDPAAPPLSVALQGQLGLRLESVRGAVDVLVIEAVQQPADN